LTATTAVAASAARSKQYLTANLELTASLGEGWRVEVFEKQDAFKLQFATPNLSDAAALAGRGTADEFYVLTLPVPVEKIPGTPEQIADQIVLKDAAQMHQVLFGEKKDFLRRGPFQRKLGEKVLFSYELHNDLKPFRRREFFGWVYLFFPPDFATTRKAILFTGLEVKREHQELPENLEWLDDFVTGLRFRK
jgi:hypothetical protein